MKEDNYILHAGLNKDAETIFANTINDEGLIDAITKQIESIEDNGGEIFKHKNNVIATSEGYFCALYEDNIKLA